MVSQRECVPAGHEIDRYGLRLSRLLERDHRSRPTPDFRTIELSVDEKPSSFSFLLEQNVWVALGYKEDVTISITARNIGIEDVSLVAIRDVEPYIGGRRRLLEPPSETPDG